MSKTTLLIATMVLFPLYLLSQVKDDFSDGNFCKNPAWTGDTTHFEVNGYGQLQLKSAGSDTSCLFTPGWKGKQTEWSFWLKMAFNTSLNNHARFYLGTGSYIQGNSGTSLFLQAGGSSDSIIIYRMEEGNAEVFFHWPRLKTGKSLNTLRFRITLDSSGQWNFFADSTGGREYEKYGEIKDARQFTNDGIGIYCRYTSSNSGKIYFDDIYQGPVLEDTVPPQLISANFDDSSTLCLVFGEKIDTSCILGKENFSLKKHDEISIQPYVDSENQKEIYLRINYPDKLFFIDTLLLKNIKDLSGNRLCISSVPIAYYIPGICGKGDMAINEVLFDPDHSGCRFIEITNCSSKLIDLSGLIAGAVKEGVDTSWSGIISAEKRMLSPGDLYAICSDPEALCARYFNHDELKIADPGDFPSMDSDTGSVFLMETANGICIDRIMYGNGMHFPFLSETSGVSLERMDPGSGSTNPANWHSASETSGFASPGMANSRSSAGRGEDLDIGLSGTCITPDNDGRDDLLEIRVNRIEPGSLIRIRIFNDSGLEVRSVADSVQASEGGMFVWDGTSASGSRVAAGYYIVLVECISQSGSHKSSKLPVAVLSSL
jgi:hypothetical protein